MALERVYSTRFIGHKGLDSAAPYLYAVPQGFTAVVVSADVYHGANLLNPDTIFLKDYQLDWTWWQSTAGANTSHFSDHWGGRVVFTEGEEFGFQVNSGLWDVTCNGYLFEDP